MKTLDLGVQAAQAEQELATEAAEKLVTLRVVTKAEPKPATPARPVGSLKNSSVMQRLQAQRAGQSEALSPDSSEKQISK